MVPYFCERVQGISWGEAHHVRYGVQLGWVKFGEHAEHSLFPVLLMKFGIHHKSMDTSTDADYILLLGLLMKHRLSAVVILCRLGLSILYDNELSYKYPVVDSFRGVINFFDALMQGRVLNLFPSLYKK